MKMKKTLPGGKPLLLLFLLCCALALGACANAVTNIPYAAPAPAEQLCTLEIAGTLQVTQFDGQAVDWRPDLGDNWAAVRLAEGRHTFVVDCFNSLGGDRTANGITLSYDGFKAGRTYRMVTYEGKTVPANEQRSQSSSNLVGQKVLVRIDEVSR
jgi:hypothetical protein